MFFFFVCLLVLGVFLLVVGGCLVVVGVGWNVRKQGALLGCGATSLVGFVVPGPAAGLLPCGGGVVVWWVV